MISRSIIESMFEPSEIVTIRHLPDGDAHPARIVNQAADRIDLMPIAEVSDEWQTGALVEIRSPKAIYLGEVAGRQPDSLVTVAVEHFIDRASLAQVEKVWKTTEGD